MLLFAWLKLYILFLIMNFSLLKDQDHLEGIRYKLIAVSCLI
ncbi:hypothetical protein PVOR_09330 [Paenibacillus vortex V453]|uniref:Uncharacterized protein n=1 Tax=Paenibacillus vortex V453 TaxID=715225 RepID=A0A2R9SYI3_9BACL|nr:hypothetical protein PVOR_09330 [Paenibacillus vortex V453]